MGPESSREITEIPALAARLADGGQETVREYSWASIVRRVTVLYDKVSADVFPTAK